MSNSMYNPMIYCFMNNRFRQGFRRVFRFFFPCCDKCCSGGTSSNTVRGTRALDDHTYAPQTATQYNNSCHDVQRTATSSEVNVGRNINAINASNKNRKYLNAKGCSNITST